MQAHSADEYNRHIAPYQGQTFTDATLKFSVFDETPHKSPSTATFETGVQYASTDDSSVTVGASDSQSLLSETSAATIVPGEPVVDRPKRRDEGRAMLFERLREKTAHRARPLSFPNSNSSLSSLRPVQWASLRRVPSDPATHELDSSNNERMSRPLPDLPTAAPFSPNRSSTEESESSRPRRLRTITRSSLPFMDARAPNQSSSRSNASFVVPPPPIISFSPRTSPPTPTRLSPLLVPPPPILYPSVGITKSTSAPVASDADVEMESPNLHATTSGTSLDGQAQQVPAINAQPGDAASAAATSPVASELLSSLKQDVGDVKDLVSTIITNIASLKKMVEESPKTTTSSPVGAQAPSATAMSIPGYPLYPAMIPPPPPALPRSSPYYRVPPSCTMPFVPPPPPPPPPPMHMFPLGNTGHLPPPNILLGSVWPNTSDPTAIHQGPPSPRQEAKKVHAGITCDVCKQRVQGVRFKCLDCAGSC